MDELKKKRLKQKLRKGLILFLLLSLLLTIPLLMDPPKQKGFVETLNSEFIGKETLEWEAKMEQERTNALKEKEEAVKEITEAQDKKIREKMFKFGIFGVAFALGVLVIQLTTSVILSNKKRKELEKNLIEVEIKESSIIKGAKKGIIITDGEDDDYE